MATLAENIESMATLVVKVKKDTRLTENSILRIIDMNLAMAQQQAPGMAQQQVPDYDDEDLPMINPLTVVPDPDEAEDAVVESAKEV